MSGVQIIQGAGNLRWGGVLSQGSLAQRPTFTWPVYRGLSGLVMKAGTKLGILALALAVSTVSLWFYLARQVNLPDDRTIFVIAFLSAACLGVVAYFNGTSRLGGVPPAIAILIGLFLPFTILVSPQELEPAKVIKVGGAIPHFTALDDRGEIFDSAALNGHLVLIKFFRAHW